MLLVKRGAIPVEISSLGKLRSTNKVKNKVQFLYLVLLIVYLGFKFIQKRGILWAIIEYFIFLILQI